MNAGVLVVELDVARFDRELAAVRHRVSRIHRKIHESLLDLAGVGFDVPELARGERRQLDVGAEESTQQSLGASHEVVQVQHLRFENLLPTEREKLLRQFRRPFSRLHDLLDIGTERIFRLEVGADHLRVTQDHGEQVVEVVRDAAGEPPHGLHFLRLEELLLRPTECRLGPLPLAELAQGRPQEPSVGNGEGGMIGERLRPVHVVLVEGWCRRIEAEHRE